jgi:SHS family lactate transporter-like MFS transporter
VALYFRRADGACSMKQLDNNRQRRRAFIAAFLGWMLDGYDFTVLTLVLVDIGRDLHVDHAALGALGTVTLVMRLAGGIIAGTAADRWGRKRPMMVSIIWFSAFAFLSGLAPNYWVLFLCRALFGLGMGGEWAAGMPLVLEHWPEHRRGFILGILQGAFSWGFILAAAVYQFWLPVIDVEAMTPWRVLMWTGLIPALLAVWIRRGVAESPLWLAGRSQAAAVRLSGVRDVFRPQVLMATGVLAALMVSYQSMSFWYATLLRESNLSTLPYLAALHVGGIVGAAGWGRLADTRLGQPRAIALATVSSLLSLPMFLLATSPALLFVGALAIGLTGAGVIGLAPAFVGSRFATEHRAMGWGTAYHLAAAVGAIAPYGIGKLQDVGWPLTVAMATGIGGASLVTLALLLSSAYFTRMSARDFASSRG